VTDLIDRSSRVYRDPERIWNRVVAGIMVVWCVLAFLLIVSLAGCGPRTAQQDAMDLGLLSILAGMENAKMEAANRPVGITQCYPNILGSITCNSY
jgi:hypothetical protein